MKTKSHIHAFLHYKDHDCLLQSYLLTTRQIEEEEELKLVPSSTLTPSVSQSVDMGQCVNHHDTDDGPASHPTDDNVNQTSSSMVVSQDDVKPQDGTSSVQTTVEQLAPATSPQEWINLLAIVKKN